MRKRNVHIQFWLDKKEAEAFQKKVKRSGLSREAYLRHLVNGLEPQDAPPPDYYAMMRELHGIGNNLNQIARYFNQGGIHSQEMRKAIQQCLTGIYEMKYEVTKMAGNFHGNS